MIDPRFERAVKVAFGGRRLASLIFALILFVLFTQGSWGQAGRRPIASNTGGVLVSVVAKHDDESTAAITAKQISVYDNGVEQTIRNFTPDPSPSRLVLLVDNSL